MWKGGGSMKQVFEHYGNAILAAVVIVALGTILVTALKSDGYVATEFFEAITSFFDKMNTLTPGTAPTVPTT